MEDCPYYTEAVERTVNGLRGRIPEPEWAMLACGVGMTSAGVGHWPDGDDPYYKGQACKRCGYTGTLQKVTPAAL